MNIIGKDCIDIIQGYKNDIEFFQIHQNKFKKTLEILSDYSQVIKELGTTKTFVYSALIYHTKFITTCDKCSSITNQLSIEIYEFFTQTYIIMCKDCGNDYVESLNDLNY